MFLLPVRERERANRKEETAAGLRVLTNIIGARKPIAPELGCTAYNLTDHRRTRYATGATEVPLD
jgi:hypothetical protein